MSSYVNDNVATSLTTSKKDIVTDYDSNEEVTKVISGHIPSLVWEMD